MDFGALRFPSRSFFGQPRFGALSSGFDFASVRFTAFGRFAGGDFVLARGGFALARPGRPFPFALAGLRRSFPFALTLLGGSFPFALALLGGSFPFVAGSREFLLAALFAAPVP